ncbi:GNAT family N-acetyltransferase [Priestia taiwanensis]|uniref:Spermidine acetyltransferase n=1 Tax=Priestia taiwanensis TaxID=1347902 RepID=A0A917AM91_9BACI|nr:GNAT family N-acetyltransferase [Priestia taiwanensis]MBM7362114.1 diamine N-acetyltransferase [Priestia taiwanensis]GGE59588.1 spermidine acetyltransferase [Priestia taiwanensis]
MSLHIREVTKANWRAVANLTVADEQQSYIESTAFCLAEAMYDTQWKSVGLYDGDILVGYAMYGINIDVRPEIEVWLDRFMIDRNFQRKGYAKRFIPLLLETIQKEYVTDTIFLSIIPANNLAQQLYESFGFALTGEYDEFGEAILKWIAPIQTKLNI